MIWLFRGLFVAGILVTILAAAITVLIYANVASCAENCDSDTSYVLLIPCLVLGALGAVTAFIASRFSRRLKLKRIADSKL